MIAPVPVHCFSITYIAVVFAVPGSLLLQKKANSDTFSVEAEASSFHSVGTPRGNLCFSFGYSYICRVRTGSSRPNGQVGLSQLGRIDSAGSTRPVLLDFVNTC